MQAVPAAQIGRSLRRLEDARFLAGSGRYLDDIVLPDMLHMAVLRSPHAHAAIELTDVAAARGAPGVLGVFTAADLAGDDLGPLPCTTEVASVAPMIVPPRPALAARPRSSCRRSRRLRGRRNRRGGA